MVVQWYDIVFSTAYQADAYALRTTHRAACEQAEVILEWHKVFPSCRQKW